MRKQLPKVAYFCMEYALYNNFKIYSGGLGILAVDYLKGGKVIIIFSGKAHPLDTMGKKIVLNLVKMSRKYRIDKNIFFCK